MKYWCCVLALACMTFSGCRKEDTIVTADEDAVTYLSWQVSSDGNPQIATVNGKAPALMVQINRAHFFAGHQFEIGKGVGTAMFNTALHSTANQISGVSANVLGKTYEFHSHDTIPTLRLYEYPLQGVSFSDTNFIDLHSGNIAATVEVRGLSLENSTLEIPATIQINAPTAEATVSTQSALIVKWNFSGTGTNAVVLIRTLVPNSNAKLIVKNLSANSTQVTFTAAELSTFPRGRTHLMVGVTNVERTNRGEVLLIGQSSGAQIFNLE